MSIENRKEEAARRACAYVKDGMRVGLGSGSTMAYALQCLKEKIEQGLCIQAVCSSVETQRLADQYQIPQLLDETCTLDLNIDGVDQIDETGNVIKGGGAALTREKILAQWADKTIWIMDEQKPVKCLDSYTIPIEIIPFALKRLYHVGSVSGYRCAVRKANGETLKTDNGNNILDVYIPEHKTMKEGHMFWKSMAGVVETGYFEGIHSLAIIAGVQGILERDFGITDN